MKPILNKELSSEEFIEHYYLKNELIDFCKKEGLQTKGKKSDLINRISCYLDENNNLNNTKIYQESSILSETPNRDYNKGNNLIGGVKKFFEDKIGLNSEVKSNFQCMIKNTRKALGKQYQYDYYIREFFLNNPDETFENAVQCWKYKKSLKGSRKYDDSDLVALA